MFKTRLVLMALLAAVVVSSPVQAQFPYLVDPLDASSNAIKDPFYYGAPYTGRWHDDRELQGQGTGYFQEWSVSAPGAATQDGSMIIDYSVQPPAWDREMRGSFKIDPDNPQYAPPLPDLTNLQFTWWEYKGNITSEPNLPSEHVQQFQIYSESGRAFYEIPHATTTGWRQVVTPMLDGTANGWVYEGVNLAAVEDLNFWCSSWDTNMGNIVAVDDIWLIPEPATMMLLGLGGLTLLRRRKA